MSAPLLWILLPAGAAFVLLLLRQWERVTAALGIGLTLALAWLAWALPIGERVQAAGIRLELTDTFAVLGRRFVLSSSDSPALILIYLTVALWFGGALAARAGRLFVPIGLGMAALLTAALAVEPFLYAALLIEMVVLLSIPLLTPANRPAGRGVLRYLTLHTLGMPFFLLAGWMLTGAESAPADSLLALRAGMLLALGMALFLGIFPFHTWMPMLAEETHPYIMAYVSYILSLVIIFFGLGFLDRFAWLRESPQVFTLLRLAGGLMAVVGGLWAAFQRHLGRMLGFAVMMETGLTLLAVGGAASQPLLWDLVFALLAPRGMSLAVWALALATLANASPQGLRFRYVQGLGRRYPLAMVALLMAHLSLAGLPMLAGFPLRLALLEGLAAASPLAAVAAWVGCLGLAAGALRSLAVLITGPQDDPWRTAETWREAALLLTGGIALMAVGFFSQYYLPVMARMTGVFFNLAR
jgi:formate hydrogenlyase subunit 3/multisubunit Na+/H+ antiporter MnhD subunit